MTGTDRARPAVVAAAVVALVVLVVVASALAVAGVGVGAGGLTGGDGDSPGGPDSRAGGDGGNGPEPVVVVVRAGEVPPTAPVVDQLAPAAVLALRLAGFEANHTGSLHQCPLGPDGAVPGPGCGESLPVRFDDWGRAEVLFLALASVPTRDERLDCARRRCQLVVSDGAAVAAVETVFGAEAPPPLRLEGPGRVGPEEPFVVTVTGAPGPGAELALCQADAVVWPRCRALEVEPAPASSGAENGPSARNELRVSLSRAAMTWCSQRSCLLTLFADEAPLRGRPLVVRIEGAGPLRYDPGRLGAGLALAATALALALVIGRRTDWSVPTEAATPDLDAAPLADLDREAAEYEQAELGTGVTR